MTSEIFTEGKLVDIPTSQIIRNPQNPRLIFDKKKLKTLEKSIQKVKILVPLTVFLSDKEQKYMLIDGERRLKCAKRLNMPTVPAIIIDEPSPEAQAIMRMFNIHHLGVQWGLLATTMKLERLMIEIGINDTKSLSGLTGMSSYKVNTCKRLLSYPRKYLDLLLLKDEKDRITADFFIELYPILESINRYIPEFEYPENDIIDKLIDKFENNKISSAREFRKIRTVFKEYNNNKITKNTINNFLIKVISDEKSTIDESLIFLKLEHLSVLNDIIKLCKTLKNPLSELKYDDVENHDELRAVLSSLSAEIERLGVKINKE